LVGESEEGGLRDGDQQRDGGREILEYGFEKYGRYGRQGGDGKEGAVMGLGAIFARRFSRLLNRPMRLTGRDGKKLGHLEIGELGERIAVDFLKGEGRRVLYRNFRAPKGGEVDIVAREGKVLSFVEVKTRTSEAFGRPLDAVDREKERLIERGANEWLRLLGTREIPWRFDVVEVVLREGEVPKVNVVRDAF